MHRSDILNTANHYITKDRAATHGGAEDSFGEISKMWTTYLGANVSPEDVCIMMVLLKIARFKNTPSHSDHTIDICGYAAIAGELATRRADGFQEKVEEPDRV